MSAASFRGALLLRLLADAALPPRARRLLGDALAGDAEAAERLAAAVAPAVAGDLVALAYGHRMAREPFASLLAAAWQRDHRAVVRAAGSRRRVRGFFALAGFRLPARLPALVPVWRAGATYAEAVLGFDWSLSRPAAGGVLVQARVPRADIGAVFGRDVVVLRRPMGAVVVAK